MELRQLHYFVTLAEELHFGRAAAREHIVQSALSQRLQRLERELGVTLMDRTTHHVQLTAAGVVFLVDARHILAHVERAAVVAQRASRSRPSLRVGVVDASFDSMSLILHEVQTKYPDLEIHQVEVGVPEQFQRLVDGRLDVGIGRASLAPPAVASELFRLDPLGVLVAVGHAFAALSHVPVATLAAEPMLLSEEDRAPEFNQFVIELCRSVGFIPTLYRGTVDSILASVDLVAEQRCVMCAPASCLPAPAGIEWRSLVDPVSRYPWSVLWRAGDSSEHAGRHRSHALGAAGLAGALDRGLNGLLPGGLSAFVLGRAPIRAFFAPPPEFRARARITDPDVDGAASPTTGAASRARNATSPTRTCIATCNAWPTG